MDSLKFTPSATNVTRQADEIVSLKDVRRNFGDVSALAGISLTVKRGEVLGIIGRSGAGKSTLIRCLNGLERSDSGDILIEGQKIDRLPEKQLQPMRRKVGMIFQHFNLLSAKTVEANVALPLKIAGLGKNERLKRAHEMLELVGLMDKAKAFPGQLSGGQKQRVGIARALAGKPALLLSDEATSALDPETTRSILALLKDINRKLGLTIVLITHEMDVVRAIADRVAVIDAGRIVEEGDVWSVFSRPEQEITKSLLAGSRPKLPDYLQEALGDSGTDVVLSVDLVGTYAQQALFNDLSQAFSRGAKILEGSVEHIQQQPVGRFFITLPNANTGLLEDVQRKLTAAGARVEVLGNV